VKLPSRLQLLFAVYAIGVIGWAIEPALARLSSDISTARRVISRHLLSELALTPGIETTTELLHPAPQGWLLLEIELTMRRDDLEVVSPWNFKTPFEWEYDIHTVDGRQVYSGAGPEPLPVLQKPIREIEEASDRMVRVVHRHIVHRALDMGPVFVRLKLSSPTTPPFADAVFRVYDDLDTRLADAIRHVIYPLTIFTPFAILLGLVSFVLTTRRHRRAG
jgi:hypothetical protein